MILAIHHTLLKMPFDLFIERHLVHNIYVYRFETVKDAKKVYKILNKRTKVLEFVNVFINEEMFANASSIEKGREFTTGTEYEMRDDGVISVFGHDWDNVIANTKENPANEQISKYRPKYYEQTIDKQQSQLGWDLHKKLQKIYKNDKAKKFMLYFIKQHQDTKNESSPKQSAIYVELWPSSL